MATRPVSNFDDVDEGSASDRPFTSMHMTSSHTSSTSLLLACAMVAFSAGCVQEVVVGAGGGDGSGGASAVATVATGTADGSTGSATAETAQATWQFYGDIPEASREEACPISPCGFTSDTRIFIVDSGEALCEPPFRFSTEPEQAPGWRCVIGLPGELQVPGTYALEAYPEIGAQCWGFFVDVDGMNSSGAVGGPSSTGSIEVVSVDEDEVVIRLDNLFGGMFIGDEDGNEIRPFEASNGEFRATACAAQ